MGRASFRAGSEIGYVHARKVRWLTALVGSLSLRLVRVLPFARLVFSANHPPRSGDASHAFYRRWLVVPFDRTFEPDEQIPRAVLDARLSNPKELSGVLNKALEALRGIRERGGFMEPQSVKDALAEFQQTTDPLTVWLERNTIEHPNAMVAQDELRRAYNTFCENSGKPGMTPQAFGRALARAKPGVQKGQRTWRGVPNSRVYIGIGLKGEGPDDPEGPADDDSDRPPDHDQNQRAQRDQRNDPNCFVKQDPPLLQNNREKRVDRVGRVEDAGDATPSEAVASRRLSAEEVEVYKRMRALGKSQGEARRIALRGAAEEGAA